MTDFVRRGQGRAAGGKSVEKAAASIDLGAKYRAHEERYQAAVQAIYDELKSQTP